MLSNWRSAFKLEKTLESPLDCKEMKPVSSKGNQPWIFIGRTVAEVEASVLQPSWLTGKESDAGKDWRQKEKLSTYSMDMDLSKLQEIVKDKRTWHAAGHGVIKSWTWLSKCTNNNKVNEFQNWLLAQCVPHAPSTAVSTSLFSMSVSPFLPCKWVHQYHFPRSHQFISSVA